MLPPGRLRLVTKPRLIGSLESLKTIGIVEVAAFAAKTGGSEVEGHDYGHLTLDKFCRKLRQSLPLIPGEARFDSHVSAFDKAGCSQALAEPGRHDRVWSRSSEVEVSNRPSTGNVRGDPSLRAAGRPCRMAATNPDRRQSLGHRVRDFPLRQPAPSARAGAHTTDATGVLVLRRGDRAWRGTDARADLSRALPGRRPRQGSRAGGRAHKRQSGHGPPGLRRPLC